jgi:hypothetical protein
MGYIRLDISLGNTPACQWSIPTYWNEDGTARAEH